jgi:transposase InsO family protein
MQTVMPGCGMNATIICTSTRRASLSKGAMVHDILRINHIHQLCVEYITTKMKRSLFPS